jgi:hypothetical protein
LRTGLRGLIFFAAFVATTIYYDTQEPPMTIRPALAHDAAALAAIYNQGIEHACLDGRWLDVVIVERLIEENLTARSGAAATEPPTA